MKAFDLACLAVALNACGGSLAPSSTSTVDGDAVDTAADASVDSSPRDSSIDGSSDAAIVGEIWIGPNCNGLGAPPPSAHIQSEDVSFAWPGGTIVPGTYSLQDELFLTGAGGPSETSSTKTSGVLVIADTSEGFQFDGALREDGKPDGTFVWTRGTVTGPGKLRVDLSCPQSGAGAQATWNYFADSNPDAGYTEIFINGGSELTYQFVLQQ